MTKTIWVLAFAFLVSGCSGAIHSRLVEMEVDVASPILGLDNGMPVVYPDQAGGMSSDPMAGAFGPSWEGLEAAYPQYRFNP